MAFVGTEKLSDMDNQSPVNLNNSNMFTDISPDTNDDQVELL